MKLFTLILFAGLLTGYNSYAQNYFPATGNVGIGTNNPYGALNVDPQGVGGITIGNPSVNSGGFTSLQMGISSVQNGYSFLQSVQSSGATWGNIILNKNGGNVGIGVVTPSAKLSVLGTGTISNLSSPAIADLFGVNDRSRLAIGNSTTTAGGTRSSAVMFYGMNTAGNAYKGNWEIGNDLNLNGDNNFYFYNADLNSTPLYITSTGNVSIGTTDAKGYKLAVNGSAIATSVTVKLNSAWPDYVFKKDYQLPSLSDVKAYIDQNQHLPEIPSEQQIAKDGLNLGEMNKLLMKKVEELTLYLIDEHKKNKDQQVQIDHLNKEIQLLNKKLK